MEDTKSTGSQDSEHQDIRSVIRNVIDEFVRADQIKTEPAYKTELLEERKRREQLEQRVNELVSENKRTKKIADEAEKQAAVRAELQKLGVAKVDLAFRAVRDEVKRRDDGRLVGAADHGELPLREYLEQFVSENPELLPARISGGSGMEPPERATSSKRGIDLDAIRPGMDPEELDRVRKEISRIASQSMRGL